MQEDDVIGIGWAAQGNGCPGPHASRRQAPGCSGRLGLELPITEGVCAVLSGVTLADLVEQLMRRAPTTE